MIDIHHHILPGLDDGPADREQALAMCRSAAAAGITTIVATPHMLEGVYRVTVDQVRRGVEDLNRLIRERWTEGKEKIERSSTRTSTSPSPHAYPSSPPVILPGADVHLHEDLVAKVKRGEVLTINDTGAYLLLELPPTVILSRLKRFLADMLATGVRPILTHPERHPRTAAEDRELAGWARDGGLVQVTAGAYLGKFGRTVQETAERWVQAGLVHLIATDAHPLPGREPVLREAAERVRILIGEDSAGRIVGTNPEKIINGKPW